MTGLKKGKDLPSRGSRLLVEPLPTVEVWNSSHSCVPISLAQALSKQALRPFMAYPRLALGIVDITQRTNRLPFLGIRRRSVINIALGLCRLIA